MTEEIETQPARVQIADFGLTHIASRDIQVIFSPSVDRDYEKEQQKKAMKQEWKAQRRHQRKNK